MDGGLGSGAGAWAVETELERMARVTTSPMPIIPIGKTINRASRAC